VRIFAIKSALLKDHVQIMIQLVPNFVKIRAILKVVIVSTMYVVAINSSI